MIALGENCTESAPTRTDAKRGHQVLNDLSTQTWLDLPSAKAKCDRPRVLFRSLSTHSEITLRLELFWLWVSFGIV